MQSRSGLDAGEGQVSSLDGIKPRFSGHPACRLVTILTELQYYYLQSHHYTILVIPDLS